MTRKTRGRADATPKTCDRRNPTTTACLSPSDGRQACLCRHGRQGSRVKALIVRLAVLGVLSPGLAGWIIRRYHLEAA